MPATHTPRFSVADGVNLVPPNALPQPWTKPAAQRPQRFLIVGAGKTAMDACVWLLGSGARPESIHWVVPRDSWLLNRLHTQPELEFFQNGFGRVIASISPDDSEKLAVLGRMRAAAMPTMANLQKLAAQPA